MLGKVGWRGEKGEQRIGRAVEGDAGGGKEEMKEGYNSHDIF